MSDEKKEMYDGLGCLLYALAFAVIAYTLKSCA